MNNLEVIEGINPKDMFNPSIVYRLMEDPFGVWCDFFGPKDQMDEDTVYDVLKMNKSIKYKKEFIEINYKNVCDIKTFGDQALQGTIDAMKRGEEYISNGYIRSLEDNMHGRFDLIVKKTGYSSDLGDYYYQVVSIKDSSTLKDYHKIQAAVCSHMLSKVQGLDLKTFVVYTKGVENIVKTSDVENQMNSVVSLWNKIKAGEYKPDMKGVDGGINPWKSYENKLVKDSMDLTLLYNIGPKKRDELKVSFGVNNITDMYKFSEADIQAKYKKGKELFTSIQSYKINDKIIVGDKISIKRSKVKNLHFDFETSDNVCPFEEEHIYLIGLMDEADGKYIKFFAEGEANEKKMLVEFLDYMKQFSEYVLYHWGSFEVIKLKEMAEKYPELKKDIEVIINNCVDACKVLKPQLYLPISTFSIKLVAPMLGFNWRHKGVGAFLSMTLYWDYLSSKDMSIMEVVFDYNMDDILALVHILKVLEPYIVSV